jgi:mRNA-degrading endonuclease RelE of RelBE toxin-antitoxin system
VTVEFQIVVSEGAEGDLRFLPVFGRRIILDGISIHLLHQPDTTSRRIKELRPNPVARWELRLGDYRVLYDCEAEARIVHIQVIGEKIGNRLIVRGKEYRRHESG